MATDWDELLQQEIAFRPMTGRNEYGAPAFGASVTYQARVRLAFRRVTSRITGEDTISSAQAWVMGALTPNMDDEFTLPDGRTPGLINWEQFPDETGEMMFTKLMFK